MDIRSIFNSKASRLFWRSLPNGHIIGDVPQRPFDAGQCYFTIRCKEMYLSSCRKLWKQVYPLVHASVTLDGGTQQQAVVGPVQLTALGDSNLDRLTDLNQRLIGPAPYTGGDIGLLAGLYSVPAHDAAKPFIDTVSSLAALAVQVPANAVPIANLVKSGIEGLLGVDQSVLHLGLQCTLTGAPAPLQPGYQVGIGAADSSVDMSQLWIIGGRLFKGSAPASAKPYDDHDYMLISLERVDQRSDWRTLSFMTDYGTRFGAIASNPDFSVDDKRKRLGDLWPAFQQALAASADLIDADRQTIASTVASELLRQLDAQANGNPFQKR